MLKIGIVVEDWKVPIFERHLSRAGYAFEISEPSTLRMTTIKVSAMSVDALEVVVRAANKECTTGGRPH